MMQLDRKYRHFFDIFGALRQLIGANIVLFYYLRSGGSSKSPKVICDAFYPPVFVMIYN